MEKGSGYYGWALRECGRRKSLAEGKPLHAQILSCTPVPKPSTFLQNRLLDMYAKCGDLLTARRLFDRMENRNVFSWTLIMAAYTRGSGGGKEALVLFEQMQREGDVKPDGFVFVAALQACASVGSLDAGRRVHRAAEECGGLAAADTFVGSALVDMYAKCGSASDARRVFDAMHRRDTVTWNSMIAACALHGLGNDARQLFHQMLPNAVPDRVTLISTLKACAGLADLAWGKQLHASVAAQQHGLLNADLSTQNTLLDMYTKCAHFDDARCIFHTMPQRDVVSWNVMIAGYAHHGLHDIALQLFTQMQETTNIEPDEFTFVSLLKSCASLSALTQGKHIHKIIKERAIGANIFISNGLIDMYAKCGCVDDAREVFNGMQERNIVSWSVMISGYAKNMPFEEAFTLFKQMHQEGVEPDKVTFISLLKACANLASLEQVKEVHAIIKKYGFDTDASIGNSLIDAFAKCGSLEDARRVFDGMQNRGLVSWNTIITGYAQHGNADEALCLFKQMQQECVKPDEVTFTCLLSACSHGGLVNEGLWLFDSMSGVHDVAPTEEHYTCMVDLLGRTGKLVEAEGFVEKMPMEPVVPIWMALLGACKVHGNVETARRVFQRIMKLDPQCMKAYLLMSNIYAVAGRWDDVAKLRKEMSDQVAKETLSTT